MEVKILSNIFIISSKFGLAQVVEVLWNLESTILAVWCETLPPDASCSDFVPHSYGNMYFIMLNC